MFTSKLLTNNFAKLVLLISVLIIPPPSLAGTTVDNTTNKLYKTKVYTEFDHLKINSNMHINAYGIGVESRILNNLELSCGYKMGDMYLEKNDGAFYYMALPNITSSILVNTDKQKSKEKSHLIDLTTKYYYNDFFIRADASYSRISEVFNGTAIPGSNAATNKITATNKIIVASTQITPSNIKSADVTTELYKDNILLGIKLGNNNNINDNLYLLPECGIACVIVKSKFILKGVNQSTHKTEEYKLKDETAHSWVIKPEIAVGANFVLPKLANAKVNPEVSCNYTYYTNKDIIHDSSKGTFNIDANVSVYIDRFYGYLAVTSINDSDKLTASVRLGVNF